MGFEIILTVILIVVIVLFVLSFIGGFIMFDLTLKLKSDKTSLKRKKKILRMNKSSCMKTVIMDQ